MVASATTSYCIDALRRSRSGGIVVPAPREQGLRLTARGAARRSSSGRFLAVDEQLYRQAGRVRPTVITSLKDQGAHT